jgi:glucose/arabinose dehydrogenase
MPTAPNKNRQQRAGSVSDRSLLLSIFFFVALAFGTFASARAAEPTLTYVKQDTRSATYSAALKAAGLPMFGPWFQVGPFDALLRKVQGPDLDPRLGTTYELLGGKRGTWREVPSYSDGRWNALDTGDMDAKTVAKQPTIYLRRTITTTAAERRRVFVGADAHFILTLNGKQVLYAGSKDKFDAGEESVELPLAAGENVLMFEVKHALPVTRFFLQPDFGPTFEKELYAKLDADFPTPQTLETEFRRRAALVSSAAEDGYYRAVEIDSPAGDVIEGTGLASFDDGRLAVATRRGYVYLVDNPGSEDPRQIKFTRFAEGLHEPLGLGIHGGAVHVVNRGEVTKLEDTDGDGRADRQECVANDWGVTGNYHEYAYGLPADGAGNMYVALNLSFGQGGQSSQVPYRGCVLRVTPEGKQETVAVGLRSPNGIGRNAAGDIFVTDNQGNWVPACPLYHVEPGDYLGVPQSLPWLATVPGRGGSGADAPRKLPAVWFPYDELCQSATDIQCDTSGGKFGPFAGQIFVGEMTKGLIARVALEKVNGKYQGACFLFRRGLGAVNRMAFGPDGKLYFARVNRGWGGGGLGDGLARLEFTGRTPLEIQSVHLLKDGFELKFTKPVAEQKSPAADQAPKFALEQYGYHHWATYGSPRINLETVEVTATEWAPDRRSVRLTTSPLKAERVCKISLANITAADGDALLHADAFYTMNELMK